MNFERDIWLHEAILIIPSLWEKSARVVAGECGLAHTESEKQ